LAVFTGDWEGAWNAILGIIEGVVGAIIDFVQGGIEAMADFVVDVVDNLKVRFEEGFNTVKDAVMGVWDGMIDGVKSGFVSMVNFVIDKLNFLIRKVNQGSGLLNKIPGVNIPQMSEISKLGFGGQNVGGTFTVGDRGLPEVVTLPGGSSVSPLAPGESKADGLTINLNAPQNDPAGIAREIGWELTKRGL
jgi:phage-related protein